jgi:hypothetical protein
VQNFMKTKYEQDPANNKQVMKMTKWRAKEKQAYKQKILEKALQKNITKRADSLEIPVEALKESKIKALWKIMEMLEAKDLSMKDMALWLEKIKTELGEPAHIGANYNLNANKVEWLTDEESQALDTLFKWKSQNKQKSNK